MCFPNHTSVLYASLRLHPDGKLTSGLESHDIVYENTVILTNEDNIIDTIEDNVFNLTIGDQLNTMNTGEDEPSSGLNGRLRPRKSNAILPSPAGRSSRRTDNKLIQDKQRRNVTPSKTEDLVTPQPPPDPHLLCPYCERKFATKLSASKHARRIHLSTSKQDHFINCLYCNHSEAESHDIIRHMVDSHPNQYFACLDCHTRFLSTTELAEHKLNVCEKQKAPYRSKLRQKSCIGSKKNKKRLNVDQKGNFSNENKEYTNDNAFSGMVISCELKPSQGHDAADIEDKITTNLILPPGKTLGNASLDKNAVMVLDDLQWNKRIATPNFTFHNTDADQILSRLGVVHRSPRVGESTRRAWLKMFDENNQKFEKCFDTNFYSKVASNVQENLSKFLDGSFNFNPDADSSIKTRKSKSSVVINTAEGFPILLAYEQFTRHILDGYMPRPVAPRHKWKWGNNENEENTLVDPNAIKRDSHVNNCIITLVSSLDIWTQLRMRRKYENVFSTTSSEKTEKNNVIALELKEILESRELPTTSSQIVKWTSAASPPPKERSEWASYLGLSPTKPQCEEQPAVLSGEWVRPRCYICCACGEQTRDARGLTSHMSTQHPYAQVQHYEIVGDTLLNSDIIKHLYVPPSQLSNRTRPPRGFRDCTKCKKSIALEDMHQHMLDCAGDTPAVRRKVRYRPFGVRRRRSRLPENTIRKKIRKEIRSRHRQKVHMRTRPKIRSEVGDAETIRKMIADLPAKRARVVINNSFNNIRSKQGLEVRSNLKINRHNTEGPKYRITRSKKSNLEVINGDSQKKQADNTQSDDDDEPLKINTKSSSDKKSQSKESVPTKTSSTQRSKRSSQIHKKKTDSNKTRFFNKSNISGSSAKRVNVKNSGVRVRERGTRNERNDRRQSKSGSDSNRAGAGKDSGNHNNVAPVGNVPLKHSIARLTADNDSGAKTPQQLGPTDTAEQRQVVIERAPTDKQQLFENDTKTDKLDKPPLSQNVAKTSDNVSAQKCKANKPRKRLTDCIAMLAKKVGEPGQELNKTTAGLLTVTSESDKPLSESKGELTEGPEMDKRDETLAKYHDSLRKHAKTTNVSSHGKIPEREKSRRVSTSLIEQTPLQIPFATDNNEAPNDPDPPVIVSRHMPVVSMTDNSNIGITPAKVGPRMFTEAELIESRYQRKSTEQLMSETTGQRRSSYYGPNFVQPSPKQVDTGRRKSSRQSATRAESESRAQQIYNAANLPNFPFYPRPEFYPEPSSSNNRRKSYDCVPTSTAYNQYYHSQLSQRQNFLSVPMFVRPDLRNIPIESIDKNLALQLLNYSRNPTDMTAFNEASPPELAHFVNWEGHPRHLYTSPSPDSRHLRHDSLQRDTIPSLDINLENPHNYISGHRTTPVKTPDGRICVTPVQLDPHRPSPDNSGQQLNNNYMRPITTPELHSMNPPLSVGLRRESCKRILDTSEKGFHSHEFSDGNSQNKIKRSPDNVLNVHAIYPSGSEYAAATYHHPRDKVSVSVSPLSQDGFDYKKATPVTFFSHVSGKSNDSFNTSVSAETSISDTQKRGYNEVADSERSVISRDFEHDVRQVNVYDRIKLSKEQYSDATPAAHYSDRFQNHVAKNISSSQQDNMLDMRIPKDTVLYPEGTVEQVQKSQSLLSVTQPHYDIPTAHRTSVADASKHTFSVDENNPSLLDNYKDELPLNMVRICSEFEQTYSNESRQMPLDLSTRGPEDKKEEDYGPEDMSIKTHEQKKMELRVKSMSQLSDSEYGREKAINLIQNKATPELEVEKIRREQQYVDTFNESNYNQIMINEQHSQNIDKPEVLMNREHVEILYDHEKAQYDDKSQYSQYVERTQLNKTIGHNASPVNTSKCIPKITVNLWEKEGMMPVASDVENLRSQHTGTIRTGLDLENRTVEEFESHNTSISSKSHIALQTDNNEFTESTQHQGGDAPTNIGNVQQHDANATSNIDKEDKRKNLPKEIIDLIGDLPKGNLDKLLDILPQYVCVPNIENKDDVESASKENSNAITPVVTSAVNITDKTLTVNTNLLSAPSCILPKKRHSPKPSYAVQYQQKYLEENASVITTAKATLPAESLMMQDVKPNIGDPCTEVLTKSLETIGTENTEMRVVDLTEDNKTPPASNEIISKENSATLSQGQDHLIPTKTKNPSDKTAILRAVRFKKSLGDAHLPLTSRDSIQNVSQDLSKLENPSLIQNPLPAKEETEKSSDVVSQIEKDSTIEQSSVSDAIEAQYEIVPQENIEQNHFLELSSKGDSNASKISSSEICLTSVAWPTAPEENDIVVKPITTDCSKNIDEKTNSVDLQENHLKTLTVNCDLVRLTSQDTEHVSPDSVLEPKTKSIANDKANNDIESAQMSFEKPDSSNEVLSDTKNIEEYDSDDNVSLAFIVRQKQLDQSVLSSTELSLKTENKQKKSIRKSKKIKKPKKKNTKSSKSKNLQILALDKIFTENDEEQKSTILSSEHSDINKSKQVVEDDFNPSTQQNADNPIKTTEPLYESDVNKENDLYDQMNKIKENLDQRTLNEKNIAEEKADVENEINKTLKEIKDLRDSKEDEVEDSTSNNKGKKRKKGKGLTDNNKKEDNETLHDDICEIDTSTAKSEDNSVKLNSPERKMSSEIQDLFIPSDMDLKTKKKAKKCRTKQRKRQSLVENNGEEIILSTETVAPSIPLRRSRRGKSFYADTDVSVNTMESTGLPAEKLPLTKKQLIFSKLLQDENETHNDSNSDQEKEVLKDTISITCTGKKKGKPVKRKKSPKGKKNVKKNKSLESSNEKEFPNDNITEPTVDTKESLTETSLNFDSTTEGDDNSILNTEQHDNTVIEHYKAEQPTTKEKRKSESIEMLIVPKKTKLTEEPDENMSSDENNANGYDSENLEANEDDGQNFDNIEDSNVDLNKSLKYKQEENVLKTQYKENKYSVYRKRNDSGSISEPRTTCYNRQIEYRRSRSSIVLDRNSEHYDPYDINLDDMIEIEQPIIKTNNEIFTKSDIIEIAQPIIKTNNEIFSKSYEKRSKRGKRQSSNSDYDSSSSDSDSSRSDVPLQKYFDEKRILEHKQSKDNKKNMIAIRKLSLDYLTVTDNMTNDQKHIEETEKNTEIYDQTNVLLKDDEPETTASSEVNDVKENVSRSADIAHEASHSKNITKSKNKVGADVNPDDTSEPKDIHEEKPIKEKKCRKSLNAQNMETDITENRQPSTDKFLENFGFFSERKPRKSNLLASKRIAETMHMMNDSDDAYFNTRDRANKKLTHHKESKKTSETETMFKSLQDSVKIDSGVIQSKTEHEELKDSDKTYQKEAEMDSITTQNILNTEEVRNLENDFIDGFRKAADENVNQRSNKDYLRVENNLQNEVTRDLTSPEDLEPTNIDTKKGKTKPPKIRPPGYKELMYPEINIDEIDLFEDKFDKIKRKCRSQATAAKQTTVSESSTSDKSRKKPEKKIKKKCAKKNIQSSNVPTKAALKGFDGIKISIPTQDLNMPPIITPPRQQKKRKGGNIKKKRDRKDSDSSSKYDSDPNIGLHTQEKDIYEFKDNDDTELLELRPSTVMDRFRSLNKEQSKQKDKCKDSQRHGKSSRNTGSSDDNNPDGKIDDSIDDEVKSLEVDHEHKSKTDRRMTTYCKLLLDEKTSVTDVKYELSPKKHDLDASNIQGQASRKKPTQGYDKNEDVTKKNIANDNVMEVSEVKTAMVDDFDDDSFEGTDNIPLASTARFVPPTNDDSSFEWNSSPESGYVYMSENIECNCTPELELETGKKGCDSLACLHLKNNAEKKAVMGKIFKNNAVRENSELLEGPKDMDQLFDSLLESNSNDASFEQNDSGKNNRDSSPVAGPSTAPVFCRVSPQTRVAHEEDKTLQDKVELDAFSRLLNTPSTSAAANVYAPRMPPVKINDSNNDDLYRQCILTHNEDDTNDSFTDQSINVSPVDEYVMMSTKNTQTEDPETIVEAPKSKPRCDDDESDLDEIESNDFIVLRRYVVTDTNGSQTEILHSDPVYSFGDEYKSFTTRQDDEDTIGNTPQPGDYTMMSTKCTQTEAKKNKSKSKHGDDQRSDDDSHASDERLPKDKITLKRFVVTTVKTTQTEHHKIKSRKFSKHDESNPMKFVEPSTSKDKRLKAKSSKKSNKTEIEDHNGSGTEDETSTRPDTETVLRLGDSLIEESSNKPENGTSHNYEGSAYDYFDEDTGVARQRARRKCTVGKQNVLAEHWSSESEVETVPARPSSADSVIGTRRKKGRKREGQQTSASGKRARHARKEGETSGRAPPPGPTIRARPALMPYWSSDTEDTTPGTQPQHGWIVGDSHKKLVTLLANAKGRKRSNDDKRILDE